MTFIKIQVENKAQNHYALHWQTNTVYRIETKARAFVIDNMNARKLN